MLEQQIYAFDDPVALRGLIGAYGWATLVAVSAEGEPLVTHLPVIPDPENSGAVVGHLARTDPAARGLGERPAVLVVQGPHGYVSPSFYQAGPYVPTWNHITVHLHGTPCVLDPEETYAVLSATVDHFESARPEPFRLADVAGYARRIAPATTGFRLVPARVVAKAKLSQDKPAEIIERVIHALETDAVHRNPLLAAAMRAASG
ncbi:FMN-binding negative transcriptional regulator [Acrocarpospora macrocephala]|uniref:Transcriptional regulator n=1 Tax=Acrocarpospora macrocephala TaxID=150177 RepID=A0A5M3WKL9_9ACTN|nr:FMN-binding negative transcriptional regulator [Acrocarpospora macrocephala]GES09767.1 hypothetical protein Amac_033630 [Acrocarpospora macrocephala]